MFELAHVTNYVLFHAKNENVNITPMKLQKILYFLYKEYLKLTGTALFAQRFEAWKYGPALSDVYQAYKSYGSSPIRTYYHDSDGELSMVRRGSNASFEFAFTKVWNNCKDKSGIELSKITHTKGSAWYKTYMSNKTFISDDDIKEEPDYFSCES